MQEETWEKLNVQQYQGREEVVSRWRWPIWPKILQVNKHDVYIMAGQETNRPVVVTNITNKTYHLSLTSNTVTRKSDMKLGRLSFGVCNICNYIYVAGGATMLPGSLMIDQTAHCERYDIIQDRWETIETARLPSACVALSLIPI